MRQISVVVPVFKVEKYINKSLDSMLSQSFTDFELILVDDGSPDNSGKICDEYAKKDPRIKVIHKENGGSGSARNAGIDAASGKYVMFLDADDWFELDFFEGMHKLAEQNAADLVICGFKRLVFTNETIVRQDIFTGPNLVLNNKKDARQYFIKLLQKGIILNPWNKIFRLALIKQNNIRYPNAKRSQDAFFNAYYYNVVNSVVITDKLYCNYRDNDVSTAWLKFPKEYFDIALSLNKCWNSMLNDWDCVDKESIEYLSTWLVYDVNLCFISCFSPRWNYTFLEKYRYIKSLLNDNNVKQASKNAKMVTYYQKLDLFLIKLGSPLLVTLYSKVKVIMKVNFPTLFQKFKRKD